MSENPKPKSRTIGVAILVVVALFLVITALFFYELLSYDPRSAEATAEPAAADSYADVVSALLANADPANGSNLVVTYGCTACHREGAANGVAPAFVGVAERAATRRAPMPAAAYIYESIIHPGVYLVEGFPNSMLPNYQERLTGQELGDIIAYLLTPDAQ